TSEANVPRSGRANTRFTLRMKRGMGMGRGVAEKRGYVTPPVDPARRRWHAADMKPTLVTGANGHLGNNLCRQLVARAEPVRAMIRPNADPASLAGLEVEIVRGDILDAASVAAALDGCGEVYHVAAGFLMWSRDPERDIIRPSVEGTRIVLEAAARAGVDKVVYTSSSGTTGHPGSPDAPFAGTRTNTDPHTHSPRGKLAAERDS